MHKEFCFLILLFISSEIYTISLKAKTKVFSTLEEYGRREEGSSISLKKFPKDATHSLSLLSEYQDYMVDYSKCIVYN